MSDRQDVPPTPPTPQQRSAANGSSVEAWAQERITGLQMINKLIDARINGQYLEIKSCLYRITDNSHTNKSRYGRFILDEAQDEFLRAQDGLYLFCVIDEHEPEDPAKILKAWVIPAKNITLNLKGRRAISWRTIEKFGLLFNVYLEAN